MESIKSQLENEISSKLKDTFICKSGIEMKIIDSSVTLQQQLSTGRKEYFYDAFIRYTQQKGNDSTESTCHRTGKVEVDVSYEIIKNEMN